MCGNRRRRIGLVTLLAALSATVVDGGPLAAATVADRLREFGSAARLRLDPYFDQAAVAYPPSRLTLVGLKGEGLLDLYAANRGGAMRFVRSYPIQAASGVLGPKLRLGDQQVPEGLYRIELLNPNSRFHVSLRVNYPNAFDRRMALAEGRRALGGDIMIHGNRVSIGCLAMGDEAAEDLFVLAADTGLQHIDVILAPVDLRYRPRPSTSDLPGWTSALYADIRAALAVLPAPDRR